MFHRSDPIDYIQRARLVRKTLFENEDGAEIEKFFDSPFVQEEKDPRSSIQEENARRFAANGMVE